MIFIRKHDFYKECTRGTDVSELSITNYTVCIILVKSATKSVGLSVATHYNTLQLHAVLSKHQDYRLERWNTLQHTALHCN